MSAITSCKRCGAPLGADEAQKPLQGMCTRCLFELGLEEGSHVVITGTGEAPAPPPTPEELQPLFPQFELIELLGQGGMGVVYRARQKGLGREVALKVLPAKAGRNPAFAERFAREAKALASLSHPNITSVYDFGKAGEHFFLVMELVDGLNLRQLVRAQRVAPKQALQIVEQICDALQYAHDEGVVHRDIKPENILLDRKGRLKITDFGLAKLLDRAGGPPSPLCDRPDETHRSWARRTTWRPSRSSGLRGRPPGGHLLAGRRVLRALTGELPIGRFASPSGKVQVDVRLDAVVLRALGEGARAALPERGGGQDRRARHRRARLGGEAVRPAPGVGPAPAALAPSRRSPG
jgi:tRNA A-37 threonylcarbamoyl transferase component Bud32